MKLVIAEKETDEDAKNQSSTSHEQNRRTDRARDLPLLNVVAHRDILRGLKTGSRLWRLRGVGRRRYQPALVPSDGQLTVSFVLIPIQLLWGRLARKRHRFELRANLEYSLKEAVYNLLSWVRDNDDRGVDHLMEEINHLFVHSIADANVQS